MGISLQKGQKISLSKEGGDGLSKIIVGLGWDPIVQQKKGLFGMSSKAPAIDCDASVLMLQNGKLTRNEDLVYFANLKHESMSVLHQGDNLTGDGDGDDEQVVVELTKVPTKFDKLTFVVNIYQAVQRNQNFGMIQNAYIRVVNSANGQEICKFNLSDDYSGKTAMVFGEVYRYNNEWKFNAIGDGTTDPGLKELASRFR